MAAQLPPPTERPWSSERPELGPVAHGLLEVVTEDLLVLPDLLADRALEPAGETLVQLRSRPLRHRLVDGVADEAAVEAERISARDARAAGLDELLAGRARAGTCRASRRFRPGRARRAPARQNSLPMIDARSSTECCSGSSRSRRAASSAWIVGGIDGPAPARRPRRCTSRASARGRTGCRRPPPRFRARRAGVERGARRAGRRSAPRTRSSVSGLSSTDETFRFPPAQAGRSSRSSGRARPSRRIGASNVQSTTYSTRSRNVGSAQWRSSKTRTSGRSRGERLEELAYRPERRLGLAAARRTARSPRRCAR